MKELIVTLKRSWHEQDPKWLLFGFLGGFVLGEIVFMIGRILGVL